MKEDVLNISRPAFPLAEKEKAEHISHEEFRWVENVQINHPKRPDQGFVSDRNAIFLLTKGKGKALINMEEIELKKNSLLQIPQNTLVTVIEQERELSLSGVYFSSHFISEIRVPRNVLEVFNHFSSNFLSVIMLKEEEAGALQGHLTELKDAIEQRETHAFGQELLIINFQRLLIKTGEFRQQYAEQMPLNYSPQECLYIKFNDLVQQQFKEERIIKNYAEKLHVTPKYLGEVVKEYSGRNARTIIKDFVISEARFLLSNPALNISQIAETLNFGDVSTFGKYFKNETGLSPKQYRGNMLF